MITITSRCFHSALKGSASNFSCYKSVTRGHNYLIATRNPTKRISEPPSLAIHSIGNDRRTMATTAKPTLTLDSMNSNVIKMGHVIRGPLLQRAGEIEEEIKQGVQKPYKEVIHANIGDCHAMGQPYIKFIRDVLALVIDPSNFNESKYPEDAKARARVILDGCGGKSIGSYTDSAGIEIIRHHCAEYIQNRDGGIPSHWEDVSLSSGASQSIKNVLSLLNCKIDGKNPGIMVPIPQYPLYSATIAEFGMNQIGYYLNEENKWGLDIPELERSLAEAKKECVPRAIVVINPGNPTGQVLTRDNIEQIIKFAHANQLFVFADEVYQDNVYDKESTFHSFKKVLFEMGEPYKSIELASFMSCSKGYVGECGCRGGYVELVNLDPQVRSMFHKMVSAQSCPTTIGQAALDVVANPPKIGEPSYEQWHSDKQAVLISLKERAELVARTLNSFEGISCNPVQGAMYAFPRIELPPKAIEAAKVDGKQADTFYVFHLLEETGICIVAGSAFGQKPGTYHFRTTILPQVDKLKEMLSKFKKFHQKFMATYK